jgi:hypothetical protein
MVVCDPPGPGNGSPLIRKAIGRLLALIDPVGLTEILGATLLSCLWRSAVPTLTAPVWFPSS